MFRILLGRRDPDGVRERAGSSILAPRHWPTWTLLGLAWLISQLPYPALLHMGRALGVANYLLARKRWRRAYTQLRLCFPELRQAERMRLLYRNAQSYGVGVMERLIGWWWPPERAEHLLKSVTGLEHVEQARRDGSGVILLALHTTTMDLGATLLRLRQETDFTYRPADNPVIDWVQRRGRSRRAIAPPDRASADTVPIDAGSVRTMIRQLRAGRVVWYAPDRDFGGRKSHVFAPLFGIPAATITATSRYARLTGARVIPLNYWRDAAGGYRLRFDAPLGNFPSSNDVDDCTRINAWIESTIRAYPEQYRWTHRRFRTRPPPQAHADQGALIPAAAAANSSGGPATSRATAA